MGNILMTINAPGTEDVSRLTNPHEANWLTVHAEATGLSIVEVERLWMRFQQMGCTPDEGVINEVMLQDRTSYIGQDKFMTNILQKVKKDGVVSFQTFLNTVFWIEIASLEDKIKATFALLNNGRPMSEKKLKQFMPQVFANKTQQEYDRIAQSMIEAMGKPSVDGQGLAITEEEYLHFVQSNFSQRALEEIFRFGIIPDGVKGKLPPPELAPSDDRRSEPIRRDSEQIRRDSAPQKRKKPSDVPAARGVARGSDDSGVLAATAATHGMNVEASYTIPSDRQLTIVADAIGQRDYRLLGNRLGFFESDMNHQENVYPGDRRQVILALLHEWRRREGMRAFVLTLQRALHDARLPDVAALLQPTPTTGPHAKAKKSPVAMTVRQS